MQFLYWGGALVGAKTGYFGFVGLHSRAKGVIAQLMVAPLSHRFFVSFDSSDHLPRRAAYFDPSECATTDDEWRCRRGSYQRTLL